MKKVIAIEDMAHDLGLLCTEVEGWVKHEEIEVLSDFRGRPAVDADIKSKFSERSDYKLALKKSIDSDRYFRKMSTTQAEGFKNNRSALIEKYQASIMDLQEMHEDHVDVANQHTDESAVRAAYLLFSKAISCLKMGCDNLLTGYWFVGSIIREIDETIDLAQYFIITKDTDQGKNYLKKWFRQNYAPSNSKCREVLANHMSSLVNDIEKENHCLLLNELYQKQSKWVHPTFGVIREVTEFDVRDNINIKGMLYGITNHEKKLYELTKFYKSSIWTVFQRFMYCFNKDLPLNANTQTRLIEIDRHFNKWD